MEDINVEFQASNPRSVKLLDKLYDGHLVLNDIGFRLNEQLSGDGEITVPNEEDVQNLNDTFKKAVDTFEAVYLAVKEGKLSATKAAKQLGLSRSTWYRKAREYEEEDPFIDL